MFVGEVGLQGQYRRAASGAKFSGQNLPRPPGAVRFCPENFERRSARVPTFAAATDLLFLFLDSFVSYLTGCLLLEKDSTVL